MWYFGGDQVPTDSLHPSIGTMPGLGMRCGRAVSHDGLYWQRTDASPQGSEPASGALFERRDDELYAAWPTVIDQSGQYLLLYTAPTYGMDRHAHPRHAVRRWADLDRNAAPGLGWRRIRARMSAVWSHAASSPTRCRMAAPG